VYFEFNVIKYKVLVYNIKILTN